MSTSYILAINCGSSSIKSKLFLIPESKGALVPVADATVKNIGSKGDKVKFKIEWNDAQGVGKLGKDTEEEGEEGVSAECNYENPVRPSSER
jgi:acetate kinase